MSVFSSGKKVMRSGKRNIGPLLVLVAVSALLALVLAFIWQKIDDRISTPPAQESGSSSISESESMSQSESQSSEGESQSESQTTSEGSPFKYAVAKTDWVDSVYFDDAVFFGDSLTNGIQLYEVMSNTTVISSTGITLDNILSKAVIKGDDGQYKTMIEALKDANPKKIYIMMGANSLGWDKETFIKKYGVLLETIKEQHPQSIIYVQSILPVTAKKADKNPTFANNKIDEYNLALMELTKEKNLYFLYVAEDFKDENGCLPDEASPKDGIHFGKTYYTKWFDYLKTHTVKE